MNEFRFRTDKKGKLILQISELKNVPIPGGIEIRKWRDAEVIDIPVNAEIMFPVNRIES